jgi:transcriptional regulator with XRE-family HTH domain
VAVELDAKGRQRSDMRPLRVRLGKAIKHLRAEAGYSQEALADRAKLHRTTMSEIERGVSNVSVDIAERIAKALDLPLSQLFAEAEEI